MGAHVHTQRRPQRQILLRPLHPRLLLRYLENLARHQQQISDAIAKMNITHTLLNTSKPFDNALVSFLARRMGRK